MGVGGCVFGLSRKLSAKPVHSCIGYLRGRLRDPSPPHALRTIFVVVMSTTSFVVTDFVSVSVSLSQEGQMT